ncbi:hypothetical protein RND81_04G219100 [Saponaria officinalis]|uniref:Uncharacterized protein n=1 Tax=Saponaria officinalis TaxID=3572 RepID=A0AAW1LPM2_SAPOF
MISMAEEGMMSFSMMSVVEDALKQHGSRLNDIDFASRKAEETSTRRYEAARWLRKIVGVVCSKDLPAEPSEEDFRLGLRSGIILCNAINKVQPGAVPKVVEVPNDTVVIPDGAALMAYQYFENVRNFLVAVEEMGLPTFEASDLEQGGKTARIVICVLALKSFHDWKLSGGNGQFKLGGCTKTPSVGKGFVRKCSEPFMNSISRASSVSGKSVDTYVNEQCGDFSLDFSDMSNSHSLSVMIRALIMDKKQEEISYIVENVLSRVMEEFERHLANQTESVKLTPETMSVSGQNSSPTESPKAETQANNLPSVSGNFVKNVDDIRTDKVCETVHDIIEDKFQMYAPGPCEESVRRLKKQISLFEKQKNDIQGLKHTVHTTKISMQLLQTKYHEEFSNLGKHLHTLAHAASGYQRVLEENRRLYNQVQDLKGNIRVYCRVRPFLPGQADGFTTVENIDEGNITITNPVKYCKDGKKTFNFNKVFGSSATQAEVYLDMQPLVRSCLDGYNVCIFAYGQTGSGKTYTMTGPNDITEETYGVNYRALNDLFQLAEQRKTTFSYEVSVQMMEIYNEQVRDLLVTDGSNKRLEIRNSSQTGINVPDATRLPVSTTTDVINLMNLGHKNRAVCSTAMNDRSSRSHSCMMVHVQGKDLTSGTTLRGCMHLVDLAGSERVDKSEVTGDRLKEAQHINKSLAALGDVIAALSQKNAHVPYRNSKLTQLLQDSLGGQAKTLMFVHISPEADAIGETISTLKFAERVSTVELGAARANKDSSSDVRDLKEQISTLKAALARKDEEMERLSHSFSSTPETVSVKSTTSSPSHPSHRPSKDGPSGRRSPVRDASNSKGKSNTTVKPRRKSLDPNDIIANAALWPTLSGGKADEKVVSTSADHVEKDTDTSLESSEKLYQVFGLDDTPKEPDDILISNDNKDSQDSDGVQISMFDPVTPDSIDDLDIATSDSSELDYQIHLPRIGSLPNLVGSKIKKPQVKTSRSPEKRSLIPMPPTRRLSNGASPSVVKNGRQSVYTKRKTTNVK